jgi:hypothetical protein
LTSENTQYQIAVAINYWDDPKGLIKILTNDKVYDYVAKFYVIDGRYEGRNDEPESHPDYLIDLEKIYSKIHVVNMDGKKKRNMYWKLAQAHKMDYVIVCDSDEYIDFDVPKLESSLRTIDERPEKCYPVMQHMEGITTMSRPRLFKAPFTFRHLQSEKENTISHGSLYDKDDTEIINQMYMWFKDHPKRQVNSDNQSFRSKERVIADRVYYDETPDR